METNDIKLIRELSEYRQGFSNFLRNAVMKEEFTTKAYVSSGYLVPLPMQKVIDEEENKKSIFRNLATVHKNYSGLSHLWAFDSDSVASFIDEAAALNPMEVNTDFNRLSVYRYKMGILLKESNEFLNDAGFDIEKYIARKVGSSFGKCEDNVFVNGTGNKQPAGILHATYGALTGATASSITYTALADLYHSVDKEYRENAVWMMNDYTALLIKKIQDDAGCYVFKDDMLFGKKVIINNNMPDVESGEKPIAFGDFSYYWIIDRSDTSINVLNELYAQQGQKGYLAYKFMDGKLVRRDAIKVISISE